MKARIGTALTAVFALLLSPLAVASPAQAQSGFYVAEGKLYEANGSEFIMRGVSHPHVWYPDETDSFAGIASHGANTVRVVLGSGQHGQGWGPNSPEDVAEVISLCKQNELICMLEVHDATGYGEDEDAVHISEVVDYWIGIQDVLHGEEDHVLINIANEPYGNDEDVNAHWAADTQEAIQTLRAEGFDHTFVVDAPNWGQDWQHIMLNEAGDVHDPHGNTVFSIHMYGVYEDAATITGYIDTFVDDGLPLIVGEFGHDHSDGTPDEDTIMAHSEERGIGYIGWSWSGNSGGVEYLDMAYDFDPGDLTSWGERIFYGENGIHDTARTATVYSGGGNGDDGGNGPEPGEGECSADHSVANAWGGGFQGEVTVTAGDSGLSGWEVSWTYDEGQGIDQLWNGELVSGPPGVAVANAPYNGDLAAGQSTSFGFIGTGDPGSEPAVSCSAA